MVCVILDNNKIEHGSSIWSIAIFLNKSWIKNKIEHGSPIWDIVLWGISWIRNKIEHGSPYMRHCTFGYILDQNKIEHVSLYVALLFFRQNLKYLLLTHLKSNTFISIQDPYKTTSSNVIPALQYKFPCFINFMIY